MITIRRVKPGQYPLISYLGRETFLESHSNSASEENISHYINTVYSVEAIKRELGKKQNLYYLIYFKGKPVGFSKLIMNHGHPEISDKNVAKLERIYILREFNGKGIGQCLLDFNINFSKQRKQLGIWLNVWTENQTALSFYNKNGFKKIGIHLFQIAPNHSNPNYLLFLPF